MESKRMETETETTNPEPTPKRKTMPNIIWALGIPAVLLLVGSMVFLAWEAYEASGTAKKTKISTADNAKSISGLVKVTKTNTKAIGSLIKSTKANAKANNEAKKSATKAQTTADTAQAAADDAQATADTAKATADTAKKSADKAQATADTAKALADENRRLICKFHHWKKECRKDTSQVIKPRKRPTPRRWRRIKRTRRKRPAPDSSALASRVTALEKKVNEHGRRLNNHERRLDEYDRILAPLKKAEEKYGPEYDKRVLRALGLAEHVQALKK